MNCFTVRIHVFGGTVSKSVDSGIVREYVVGESTIVTNLDESGTIEIDPSLLLDAKTSVDRVHNRVEIHQCHIECLPQAYGQYRIMPQQEDDDDVTLLDIISDFDMTMTEGVPGWMCRRFGIYGHRLSERTPCRHRLIWLPAGETTWISILKRNSRSLGDPFDFNAIAQLKLTSERMKSGLLGGTALVSCLRLL